MRCDYNLQIRKTFRNKNYYTLVGKCKRNATSSVNMLGKPFIHYCKTHADKVKKEKIWEERKWDWN